jgi:hypothetical protein
MLFVVTQQSLFLNAHYPTLAMAGEPGCHQTRQATSSFKLLPGQEGRSRASKLFAPSQGIPPADSALVTTRPPGCSPLAAQTKVTLKEQGSAGPLQSKWKQVLLTVHIPQPLAGLFEMHSDIAHMHTYTYTCMYIHTYTCTYTARL